MLDAARIAALPIAENVAWVFPGQGAQAVGMGQDLAAEHEAARQVFDAADEALGISISRICFEGPEDELVRTVNTQPAIVTHSISALAAAIESGAVTHRPAVVAGHSLGEYAALIVAGAVSFADGVRLVRERGRLMQEACDRQPSTMAAVLGVEPDVLRQICDTHGAHVCNINAPGNITIGGTTEAVETASAAATEAGASRVVPLSVSGAFHTPLMQSAADGMRLALEAVQFSTPAVPVISNVTTQPLTSADALPDELVTQITSPVLWADSVGTMAASGITEVIEFGPGKVLTGLIRRIDRDIEGRNIGTAEEARP
ncbi:MAG: [acyl-carrier-protein] S-malonyltransferase [Chloroflexi bacterium]|nr:[acyl-carrier-protein] S-malonyltransferase [Chloroflexota bacterium]MQC48140.1 [acyl-carrier-protein] S-malonyltransferase [Chloroflexota bacterium]